MTAEDPAPEPPGLFGDGAMAAGDGAVAEPHDDPGTDLHLNSPFTSMETM